jgi:hypothetical protein
LSQEKRIKIIAKFHDVDSFTSAEAIRRAKDVLGEFTDIKAYPSTNDPWDGVYFSLQQLITDEQLNFLFDSGALYPAKMKEFRSNILARLEQELDEVIQDNEHKAK